MDVIEYIKEYPENTDHLHMFNFVKCGVSYWTDEEIRCGAWRDIKNYKIDPLSYGAKMIKTVDNFAPNYPGDYVFVHLFQGYDGNVVCSVSGLDDCFFY